MLNPMRTKFYVPNAMVKGVFSPIVAFAVFGTLFGQAQQTASPTPQPKVNPDNPALRTPGKPSASASPEEPQINPQALERLTKAADKVLNRIQSEENDLYLRVNYFEKPDRLNPSSYASKDEVAQWQGILQQLKEKHDLVAQLYTDVGKNLEAEFRAVGGNEEIVARFKKFIMDGFPWDTIEKKKTLIADFIDEQAKLLSFYDKNWGSWKKSSDSNKPEFTSASAANNYNKLRDQIVSTSAEIEKQYKAMSD
jgi:hypothetical protein